MKRNGQKELTGKQRAFIEAYVGESRFNATKAASIAGYKGKYWTLSAVGYENLRKPQIQAEISRRLDELVMPADEVLTRLALHARGSVADLMNVDGYFAHLDLKRAAETGAIHLIKKIKFNELGGVESFEIHDPQAALVHLGKHHALFTDRVTIDVNKLDSEIDVELRRVAQLAAGSEAKASGEAEGETVH